MAPKLVNPSVQVINWTRRGANGERTGYRALVMDPDAYERKWEKKLPVWQCPHAHVLLGGAELCGQLWIKKRREAEAEAEPEKPRRWRVR